MSDQDHLHKQVLSPLVICVTPVCPIKKETILSSVCCHPEPTSRDLSAYYLIREVSLRIILSFMLCTSVKYLSCWVIKTLMVGAVCAVSRRSAR